MERYSTVQSQVNSVFAESLYEPMYVFWLAREDEDTRDLKSFPGTVENCRLSVITHVILLCLSKKYQLILDISLGMWPTVFPFLVTDTANVSWSLSISLAVCSSSPIAGVHMFL